MDNLPIGIGDFVNKYIGEAKSQKTLTSKYLLELVFFSHSNFSNFAN